MGVREQVMGGRNWIQKVGERIPGFRGYDARECRRDADKLLREAVASRLKSAADSLGALSTALVKARRLDEVAQAQGLTQRLNTLADRARTAAQGYSAFFDAVKVREPELDRLYEHDMRLLAAAEAAKAYAAGMSAEAPALEPLAQKVSEMEAALDARKETLLSLTD